MGRARRGARGGRRHPRPLQAGDRILRGRDLGTLMELVRREGGREWWRVRFANVARDADLPVDVSDRVGIVEAMATLRRRWRQEEPPPS